MFYTRILLLKCSSAGFISGVAEMQSEFRLVYSRERDEMTSSTQNNIHFFWSPRDHIHPSRPSCGNDGKGGKKRSARWQQQQD